MAEFGDYCCAIDRHLHELLDDANEQRQETERAGGEYQAPQQYHVVHINEAEKLSENGSSFIAYSIQFGDYEVKRRYSEFESLRVCLCRLYPTFIVPPIPEKHSLTQYAVLQKRAKEDQYIIERRKRMLEHFLNHLAEHPILSSEHVFHRFLENGVSWTEVLHSPIITGLPKTPLHSSPSKAPGSSIADGSSLQMPKIAATNSFAGDVPVPSSALAPIKNIESRWMDCELFTSKFINQFSGIIEKHQARVYRKLGELSTDYAELGAALNGFSLLESPESLAAAVEKVGQAVDSSYIEINQLLSQMEAEVGEPIHEYTQYALIIKQVLRFRLLKNLQMDGVQDALIRQRGKLEGLLQADDEAKRLAQALESSVASNSSTARATPAPAPAPAVQGQQHRYSIVEDDGADEEECLLGDAAQQQYQQGFVTPQRANTDASSMHAGAAGGAVAGSRSRGPTNMARSEYIGQASNPSAIGSRHHNHQKLQLQQQQQHLSGMAASTPALREDSARSAIINDYDDNQRGFEGIESGAAGSMVRSVVAGASSSVEQYKGYSAGSGTPSSSPTASFGVRLLRSPKVLGDGIMSRLTYALNGMMDVDPEQLRRNQIGRASDKISMLEDQLEMLSNDLVLINTSTQDNLDRFQKQKVRELKGVLIATAKMHLEWAEKNLEIWKDTKEIIDEA
ncbi:Sorting nexin, cytoplasm-to-vacuole targeting pathway/endosomal sorting [Coemansia erecta]|nr:Sorting nexin, cytoplasm-to-vacuole targeting pathway/endosomal sorting [Coemansia erecta]